jgi:hypothetical protein
MGHPAAGDDSSEERKPNPDHRRCRSVTGLPQWRWNDDDEYAVNN